MAKFNDEGSAAGSPRNLKPGDTFTWTAKDGKGYIGRTYTLIRTERDYAYDLADAYNANMVNPNLEWAVDDSGNLFMREKLHLAGQRTIAMQRAAEIDRNRWKAAQRQAETQP